jgi:CheY-like chemotaxis protein
VAVIEIDRAEKPRRFTDIAMAAPPDLSALTILVVDDNEDNVEVLSVLLTSCGADVLTARSATGALAYIDTTPSLDAVVTDVAMPNMDGVEFARKIRQHPSRKSLPIIALTGFYRNYVAAPEFDAVLRKPINLDQLCDVIRALTRR